MTDIVKEYRPSMPCDVLHFWAKDAVAEIAALRSELKQVKLDAATLDFHRAASAANLARAEAAEASLAEKNRTAFRLAADLEDAEASLAALKARALEVVGPFAAHPTLDVWGDSVIITRTCKGDGINVGHLRAALAFEKELKDDQ